MNPTIDQIYHDLLINGGYLKCYQGIKCIMVLQMPGTDVEACDLTLTYGFDDLDTANRFLLTYGVWPK